MWANCSYTTFRVSKNFLKVLVNLENPNVERWTTTLDVVISDAHGIGVGARNLVVRIRSWEEEGEKIAINDIHQASKAKAKGQRDVNSDVAVPNLFYLKEKEKEINAFIL